MPGFCREPGTSAIDACIGLKLLLDQNLSFRLLDKLEAAYPGSTQVKFVGLDQADDLTVWQFAKDNGFTIVTKDSDFHEFSLIYGSPHESDLDEVRQRTQKTCTGLAAK